MRPRHRQSWNFFATVDANRARCVRPGPTGEAMIAPGEDTFFVYLFFWLLSRVLLGMDGKLTPRIGAWHPGEEMAGMMALGVHVTPPSLDSEKETIGADAPRPDIIRCGSAVLLKAGTTLTLGSPSPWLWFEEQFKKGLLDTTCSFNKSVKINGNRIKLSMVAIDGTLVDTIDLPPQNRVEPVIDQILNL